MCVGFIGFSIPNNGIGEVNEFIFNGWFQFFDPQLAQLAAMGRTLAHLCYIHHKSA
jgi:hypothetical protein